MTISIRRWVLTAGGAILLGLATMGLVQTASSAGNRPAPIAAPPVAAAPATPGDTAAGGTDGSLVSQLDAILAADQTAAGPATAARPRVAAGLRRLGHWRLLVHATVVVDLPKTGLTTFQLDHGTVSRVDATSLTIAEKGGGSVTVTIGKDTRVRRLGAKAAIGDLKTGDEVFAISKVEAGGTVGYLIVVPKP